MSYNAIKFMGRTLNLGMTFKKWEMSIKSLFGALLLYFAAETCYGFIYLSGDFVHNEGSRSHTNTFKNASHDQCNSELGMAWETINPPNLQSSY